MPNVIDHILVALILLWAPIDGVLERRRLQRELASGMPNARLSAYARILAWQWGIAGALLVFWLLSDRALDLLGLRWRVGTWFTVSAIGIAVLVALLVRQNHLVRTRPEFRAQVREQAAGLTFMLPHTPAELHRFTWLGITAGIVEELLCRGYLMWYFGSFTPTWAALLLSSLLFAIGHTYQGVGGIIKTGLVGVLLGSLYLASGSLWLPMVLHAAVDVLQGRMVFAAFSAGDALTPSQSAP